jgi:glycolate oxidase iron-sulfur subunit
MLEMVPQSPLPRAAPLPSVTKAIGPRRARVALLPGCAQQVLAPQINQAAARVLAQNGVEVIVPPSAGCCGALAWHVGDQRSAERFAVENLRAFAGDYDAVVTTAAGCGSGLHEYPLILAGRTEESQARVFADKVLDISVFLHRLGCAPPPPIGRTLRVAYHDACHLSHAQRVRHEPRALLRSIPGVELLELDDGEMCCGSAGTYNLDQPEIAERLGQQKADRLRALHCDLVALGNIGCQIQIRRYLPDVPVLHTIELLDRAYRQAC